MTSESPRDGAGGRRTPEDGTADGREGDGSPPPIGTQRTLYLPAPLLAPGENTLTLLELERLGDRVVLLGRPEVGPTEEYVETS
ncbi:hypothetical protein [Streptomyces hirsutus]|uniref:hypothetical protein n=1 Tax=Streptomyces hirsutus TaxID=35620 RepID=UPI0036A0A70D